MSVISTTPEDDKLAPTNGIWSGSRSVMTRSGRVGLPSSASSRYASRIVANGRQSRVETGIFARVWLTRRLLTAESSGPAQPHNAALPSSAGASGPDFHGRFELPIRLRIGVVGQSWSHRHLSGVDAPACYSDIGSLRKLIMKVVGVWPLLDRRKILGTGAREFRLQSAEQGQAVTLPSSAAGTLAST